jgi:hypothetical protein
VALAALSGLYPVADSFMAKNSGVIGGETMTLLQTIAPLAVLILLASVYAKARIGTK